MRTGNRCPQVDCPGQVEPGYATALFVSEGTVRTHVASVLRKLGRRDRTQAAVATYELGLVRPGQ